MNSQENLDLMASCIYATKFTRQLKPDQFRQIQRTVRRPRAGDNCKDIQDIQGI